MEVYEDFARNGQQYAIITHFDEPEYSGFVNSGFLANYMDIIKVSNAKNRYMDYRENEREPHYRWLYDNVDDADWIIDHDSRFLYFRDIDDAIIFKMKWGEKSQ